MKCGTNHQKLLCYVCYENLPNNFLIMLNINLIIINTK